MPELETDDQQDVRPLRAMSGDPEKILQQLGLHPDQIAAQEHVHDAVASGAIPAAHSSVPPPVEKPAEPTHEIAGPGFTSYRGLYGVPPIGPPAPPPTVPTETAPMGSIDKVPVPEVPPTDEQRQLDALRTREEKDRGELQRKQDTGSGISQIHNPFLRGLARVGDVAGTALFPRIAAMVPGTEAHHRLLMGEDQGRVNQDIEEEKAHAGMMNTESLDESRRDLAQNREALAKIKQTSEEKFVAGSEHEDPNSPTGYVAQTFAGEWKPYTPPQTYKNTKGEDLTELNKVREAEADRIGLKGEDRKYYVLNGKLKEPGNTTHVHVPSAELERYQEWKAAFRKEYGRDPNAEEIREQKFDPNAHKGTEHPTFRDKEAVDKYSDSWYQKERKAVDDEKRKVRLNNPNAKDADLQQEYKSIEAQYATRAANFENEKRKWYQDVGQKPAQKLQPAEQHAAPTSVVTPTTKQTVKAGDTVPVNQNGQITYHKVLRIENGKPVLDRNPVSGQ
jgi:hypothetical protein